MSLYDIPIVVVVHDVEFELYCAVLVCANACSPSLSLPLALTLHRQARRRL
jgi:hypothetical protein